MFGKVFATLWEGSMVGKADAQLVFVYMIANANADGVIDKVPEVIAAYTGIPVERVREALAFLESEDRESRTPDEDGRRIVRLDAHRTWGWRIVNYLKYRGIHDAEMRREAARERMRLGRLVRAARTDANASEHVRDGSQAFAPFAQGEGEGEGEGRIKGASPERREDGASGASLFPVDGSGGVDAPGGENGAGRARGARGGLDYGVPADVEAVPLADGSEWRPSVAEFLEWVRLFPGVDVVNEFRRMRAWALGKPKQQKTARGVRAFVRTWLDGEQNKGGRGTGPGLRRGPGDTLKAREAEEYREANRS